MCSLWGLSVNKRPHADLITEWANDPECVIEMLIDGQWSVCKNPLWLPDMKYRIKGKQVVQYYTVEGPSLISYATDEPTASDNLQLVFENGELISATVGDRNTFRKAKGRGT